MAVKDKFPNGLKAAMDRAEIGQSEVADAAGTSKQNVSRWVSGERELTPFWAKKLAPIVQSTVEELVLELRIPIVGLAGAGPNGSVLFAHTDGELGEILKPSGVSEQAVALEVRGTSMRGVAEDGWIIIYEDRGPPRPELYGELCVVFLEDDRVLIKDLHPGRTEGLYDLESTNAPTMRDVAVREVALVTDIKPRLAAKRFIRRNPDVEVKDVRLASDAA